MTSSKLSQYNDLSALDIKAFSESGAWMEVLHPITGDPLIGPGGEPWRVRLAGKDSLRYRAASSAAVQRRFDNGNKLSPDMLMEESQNVLIECIMEWENFILEGKEFPCSKENAEYLVRQYPWFLEQAERFIVSRENYFLANTKPSNATS